jgi:predicted  nucleic acid-binding Zn-ribbon protein
VFNELREYTALQLVQSWHKRVTDFFDPPRRIEILADCPNCGVRYLPKKVDGVSVTTPALWLRVDRVSNAVTGADCDACSLDWPIPMFENFARMIGAIGPDEDLSSILSKLLEKK